VGITRVADITGLDRIGIPVWLAIRPNARSLSGGQGKGATPGAARASAVMESIETWHVEHLPEGIRRAWSDFGPGHALCPRALDPGPDLARWQPDSELEWLEGEDLLEGGPVFVPKDALALDLTDFRRPRYVAGSSNGLASGNRLDEAVLHALYELIERDAERRWWNLGPRQQLATALDLGIVAADFPLVGDLLERVQRADCEVALFDCTGPTRLATFRCVIGERAREFRPLAAEGSGADGQAGVAIMRALTEAAQARLTFIAGSRDDRYPSLYSAARRTVPVTPEPPPRGRRAYDAGVEEVAPAEPMEEVAAVAERLGTLGIDRLARIDLTRTELGIPVVRLAAEGMLLPQAKP
jgi:ribosomal protein S12 methylthiotransferase accessory factor